MPLAAAAFADLGRIRDENPLVVNITNSVVTNTTANALLALGASPAMTHHPADAASLAGLARAVVCNMGTPGEEDVASMLAASRAADAAGVPVVFDPVAAGATPWRREVARRVLDAGPVAAIRGNASEILSLAGEEAASRGVDSLQGSLEAVDAAAALARNRSCVVCVSGAVDVVTDGEKRLELAGGHVMMTRVTGLGCTATALVGAFLAVNGDAFAATVHAMAVMAATGSLAAAGATGPGSLAVRFLDTLYSLAEADLRAGARVAS
ncbi:Hydroxyethylthiazole kinase [Solidesulfovibrio carbinoliphilus subsp. oakridgensis]|uniref:Hydroxyethylthiazole kinase n=1 Tax=Solidesulfovibrio carbinoliphilus subsp. oakridgensis TaxID=694327 RepID=G7Q7C3_9BACT|nr:hydroxyethylthiazole kinase [Solidesulfovibrio carbinoliphilus]EHJ49634.1 Hydroxyethylthiazole kinase [Solidesulfovibrio carbinoliphilus subsp. oakridgensis]